MSKSIVKKTGIPYLVWPGLLMHFCIMLTPTYIYQVIDARRRELGLSQVELSLRAFGKADNAAIQSIRRGSAPAADKLEALAAALDLDFYFGPRRIAVSNRPGLAETDDSMTFPAWSEQPLRPTALLPWHHQLGRRDPAPVEFDKEMLARLDTPMEDMRLVVPDEARLCLQLSQPLLAIVADPSPRLGGPDLWCYREGGRAILGRLQFMPGRTVIFGALPEDPVSISESADHRLMPLGKVIWLSGRTSAR
jgi:transcriptional regulator with XRE-family HTH domain